MTYRHPFLFCLGCVAAVTAACDRAVDYPSGLSWGTPETPAYIGEARLGITVNGDDRLAFISTDSLDNPRLLGKATVGFNPIENEGPHHLTSSPDGQFIYFNLSNYVVNGGSGPHGAHGTGTVPGYLVKFDVRRNLQIGQALVDRSPGDVILSADGKRVFVSHYDLLRLQQQQSMGAPEAAGYSKVFILDADSLQILSQLAVCPTGHGQALSPDGKELYLTCTQSDELAVLDISDPANPSIKAKVKVGDAAGPIGNPTYAPYAVTVHPDGTVWVSDNASGDVRAYDPVKRQMDKTRVVSVGGVAMFSDFSTDGKWLYVPHQGDDRVTAIELATLHTVTLELPQDGCLNAHALHVLRGQVAGAVVICEGDHIMRPGTAQFIDLPANLLGWAAHAHLDLGLFPDGATALPALQ